MIPNACPSWKVTALLELISSLFPTSMHATFWLTLLHFWKNTYSFNYTSVIYFRSFHDPWYRRRLWFHEHLDSSCSWWFWIATVLQYPTKSNKYLQALICIFSHWRRYTSLSILLNKSFTKSTPIVFKKFWLNLSCYFININLHWIESKCKIYRPHCFQ